MFSQINGPFDCYIILLLATLKNSVKLFHYLNIAQHKISFPPNYLGRETASNKGFFSTVFLTYTQVYKIENLRSRNKFWKQYKKSSKAKCKLKNKIDCNDGATTLIGHSNKITSALLESIILTMHTVLVLHLFHSHILAKLCDIPLIPCCLTKTPA